MIGLVVEGPSDEKVIKEICKKLDLRAEVRLIRGGFNPRRARSLAQILFCRHCEKVIMLRDSHSSVPSRTEQETKRKLESEGLTVGEEIRICIVIHAIESWLLADEDAIEDYLGIKIKKTYQPERICRPDKALDKIFDRTGRNYCKGGADPGEIAGRLRLQKVAEKCPSFKHFREVIQN